jgi:hypothetical protein
LLSLKLTLPLLLLLLLLLLLCQLLQQQTHLQQRSAAITKYQCHLAVSCFGTAHIMHVLVRTS